MRLTKRRVGFLMAAVIAGGGLFVLWAPIWGLGVASMAPPVTEALSAAGEGEIPIGQLSDGQLAETVQAIREMGARRDSDSGQTLRQLLRADRGDVRSEAAEAIGRRRDADATLLVEILINDVDPAARLGAAKGLAAIAADRTREQREKVLAVVPALLAGLADAEPSVRAWSLRALNDTCGKRFDFDARKPADEQADKVARIEEKLQRMGLLRGSSPAEARPWGVKTTETTP